MNLREFSQINFKEAIIFMILIVDGATCQHLEMGKAKC